KKSQGVTLTWRPATIHSQGCSKSLTIPASEKKVNIPQHALSPVEKDRPARFASAQTCRILSV
ncbi:MAG TPA: hypothetical protein PK373_05215, partial [Sedimentisphaerales bacterium]|nr:hypothetical protein [Sedimentisphaerales bacterium]